jgi:hypothetical protein
MVPVKRDRIVAPRIMIKKLAPEAYQYLYALDSFLSRSSLDPRISSPRSWWPLAS